LSILSLKQAISVKIRRNYKRPHVVAFDDLHGLRKKVPKRTVVTRQFKYPEWNTCL